MAFENMAVMQSWHRKGKTVRKDNTTGVLTHFTTSVINGKWYVHTLWVRLEGCTKPWPFNPNDITKE